MLEEEQLPARFHDTRNLLQGRRLIVDAAEHQRHDGGVERPVSERQTLGCGIDDLCVELRLRDSPAEPRAHVAGPARRRPAA